jgi:alpha/beta superfamily hydrolase
MTSEHFSAVRHFDLTGPAGRLEAVLNTGRPGARYAALVCHPHPLGGGSMHNKVVYHAMKALHGLGLPVLRFNFRGVGRSQGVHDNGVGEREDLRAALDWLDKEFHLPVLFAGFSFGSYVGLHTCCGDVRVHGLILLGLPVVAGGRVYTYGTLPACTRPKLFVSGDQDEFGPIAAVTAVVDSAPAPRQLLWIAGADHFFTGKLAAMQAAVRNWTMQNFPLTEERSG